MLKSLLPSDVSLCLLAESESRRLRVLSQGLTAMKEEVADGVSRLGCALEDRGGTVSITDLQDPKLVALTDAKMKALHQ